MQLKSLLAFGTLASISLADINCNGGLRCIEGDYNALERIAEVLENGIKYETPHQVYKSDIPIACTWAICAFFQWGASGTPVDALRHVRALIDHGCKNCGSNPTAPGNGGGDGELTVNYIQRTPYCEEGELCPPDGPDGDGTEEAQAKASEQAMKCRLAEGDDCED